MNPEEFKFMEVKPENEGWYFVTLYQYKKMRERDPNYSKDWIKFDGTEWLYEGYKDCCYVCFIHKTEEEGE